MNKIIIAIVLMAILSSCAHSEDVSQCVQGTEYGFFGGLWHGWIAGVSFIISLFDNSVDVYAMNNTGGWYTFGFLLGVGAFTGCTGKAVKTNK